MRTTGYLIGLLDHSYFSKTLQAAFQFIVFAPMLLQRPYISPKHSQATASPAANIATTALLSPRILLDSAFVPQSIEVDFEFDFILSSVRFPFVFAHI